MVQIELDVSKFLKRQVVLHKMFEGRTVVVGYSAPYAVRVHENMVMKLKGRVRKSKIGTYWSTINGQDGSSKFLEKPLRQLMSTGDIPRAVAKAAKAALTGSEDPVRDGLQAAADLVSKASQEIVPGEYGELSNSLFVQFEGESGGVRTESVEGFPVLSALVKKFT